MLDNIHAKQEAKQKWVSAEADSKGLCKVD